MKKQENISAKIVANIVKIRKDRDIKQATVAYSIDIDPGTYSKVESGKIDLTIDRLEKIASFFKLEIVDIIYWPHKYIRYDSLSINEKEKVKPKVTVQIELDEDKKDKVLELIFEGKEFDFL